jgi:hypothetical protein
MSNAIVNLEEKIERTKRALSDLGPMRPGSVSRQYKDAKERKRPFWQVSYTHRMKSRTEYVRAENLAAVRKETANFRKFKRLVDQWIDLSLSLSQLRSKSGDHAKKDM